MKKIFLPIICLFLAVTLSAQVRLTAQTDKTDLALDDDLTLTVQVTGVNGNVVMPQLPSLPAFNVYSREMAQSTVNGRTTLSFRYLMVPRFVGRTSIGPVTFSYGGKTYKTDPINIRIYKSATAAQASPQPTRHHARAAKTITSTDIGPLPPLEKELATRAYAHGNEPYFLVSAISNKNPYPGQSFTLAVRFYYATPFYEASYHNPAVSNLFMEESKAAQGRQNINGTAYNYEEKRYELSAVSAGKASIGAATVEYRTSSGGDSLFDRFFGGAMVSKPVTVASKPITLQVKALPVNKPASFYGAVGNGFTLTAQVDKSRVEAGDAVTLSVTAEGPGSLKTTRDLQFPPMAGITAYPAAAQTGFVDNNPSRGYKTFKTILVPNTSGQYTIEGIAWSYLDPATGTYKTLTIRPITLQVSPSTQATNPVDFTAATSVGNGIQTLHQDIEYVKSNYLYTPSFLQHVAGWKWIHALVLLWLAGCVFCASIGKKTVTKKQAYQHAKAHLHKAQSYEDIADAMSSYLLAKWQISTASLPLKEILFQLAKHQVPAATQQTFAALWKELESARFAPPNTGTNSLSQFTQRAGTLLKEWEHTR